MKALLYEEPWKMSLTDLPDPPEPGPKEVLLRSLAVGICGSDVHGFTGESGRRKPGMVMGHEVVGEVVRSGSRVTRLQPGDHVAVYNIDGCARCSFCLEGREQLCPDKRILGVNTERLGAMAEYFVYPENGLFKIDRSLDPAIGLLTEPIAVGVHAVRHLQPKPDDVIAIVGAGTIGIGLSIVLNALGVRRFYALDKVAEKLALVAKFGAIPINVTREDPVVTIRKATGGKGSRGVFEAVGLTETVRTAYEICMIGGTIVLIGNLAQELTLPLQGVTSNEITIRGSYGFTRQDFATAVELTADKSIPFERLITGSCSLGEAPGVITRMARGEIDAIKMVIRP
jgi:L-iditol 2-dehydrogenase